MDLNNLDFSKIDSITVNLNNKVNLGNYETTDLGLQVTITKPDSAKAVTDAFDALRVTLMQEEIKHKDFLRKNRGR